MADHDRPQGRVSDEDRALVARCIAGERAAQRLLFEREKRRVHATLYRIAGHNRGMDDMLQDTFITVFRSLHQFRGEAQLATWIDRCAVHVALKHLKQQRRARREQGHEELELGQFRGEAQLATWIDRCAVHVALKHLKQQRRARREQGHEELELGQEAWAERRVGLRQALVRLYAVLEQLDEKQRVAYVLHVLEGRPLSDVASLTDATVVATKVRVFRARRELERRARHDPLLAEFVAADSPISGGEEADA